MPSPPPTDHWSKNTLHYLTPHLAQSQRLVRIATGFFTVQGYNLIRKHLLGKEVNILVGYDELSRERLKQKLIDDILLHLSRWEEPNRREAVADLIGKLERGELQIIEQGSPEVIEARTRKYDHGKLFILDDNLVLVGSSNLTVSGLIHNTEALACVDQPARVAEWLALYEKYWTAPDTYDLTQALLEALRRWLGLSDPYDIYLKTIQALVPEDDTEAPRDSYKMPVKYQMVVIARVLRQINDWRGAMVVASTGLGKTIIATHVAYRLRQAGRILNVIVFAPTPVQPDWRRALSSAGLSYEIFTRNLLDQPLSKKRRSKEVRKIVEALQSLDARYLVIIDESQYFKNRLQARGGDDRRSFRRIVDAVNDKRPLVVLLTATPLARGVQDLNNQLHLLPRTAPPDWSTIEGQLIMPEFGQGLVEPQAWRVREGERFFEEFIDLPVCTVISTSQVAKDFAVSTEQGDYIEFGAERRWIPQIELRKIKVPVLLEHEIGTALDEGYFKHTLHKFENRGAWYWSEASIENRLTVAWTSSPLALQEVIDKTMTEDGYEVTFHKSLEARVGRLAPILAAVQALTYDQDAKFMALCEYLRGFQIEGRKVLIFTELRATAVYLEERLAEVMPNLRVANVVRRTEQGFELKDFETEVFDLILDFAPEANRDKIGEDRRARPYEVLISTDAYGAGVNLQDASVVISYDLAWTADTIIQRAGRILRFWREPRRVHLYVFVGDFQEYVPLQRSSGKIEDRLRTLTDRTRQAEKFSELPIIPDSDRVEYTSLSSLSSVTIEALGLVDVREVEEFTGVSRFLTHVTELNHNLARAQAIPDDISSALTYTRRQPRLYLLLRYEGVYHWALYNIRQGRLEDVKEDELLDMIACRPDTTPAEIDPNEIEIQAQHCRALWCRQQNLTPSTPVERICALYLQPGEAAPLRGMLAGAVGAA